MKNFLSRGMQLAIIRFFQLMKKLERKYAYSLYMKKKEKQVRESLSKVKIKRPLTEEQKKEIISYYKRLTGKTISTLDHEYFYSRTGIYTKDYIPMSFFQAELIGRLNRMDCYNSYSDKNLDDILLPNVKHPHYYLKNINGYYYFEGKPVDKQEAAELCKNLGDVIIKPSLEFKGTGVKAIHIKDGSTSMDGKTVVEVFDKYKKDFLIQKVVRQHALIGALNPTSVNTMRMATYRSGMEVLLVYAVIRIGRSGQVIDNQSAGGISARINPDGTLGKYAFGKAGDDLIEKTDTGIVLEGYQLPSYDKAVAKVRELHYSLPLFDLIGWDVSIDEEGEPVLIEWNGRPGPSQTASGTGYGDLTERIISEVWNRKNTVSYHI
jgi:hypothetical protein